MNTAILETNNLVEPNHSESVAGLRPWLPQPLARWSWWTRPIPAEVYAVLRIGVAAVLLLDQCFTMLPHLNALYGAGSTGAPSPRRAGTR